MKMSIKRENDKFLLITLKRESGVTSRLNRPRTSKLWKIAHENGHKTQERRIVGHPLKHTLGLMVHANPCEAPKQCGITRENDPTTRKR